jgi:hypothetical protein
MVNSIALGIGSLALPGRLCLAWRNHATSEGECQVLWDDGCSWLTVHGSRLTVLGAGCRVPGESVRCPCNAGSGVKASSSRVSARWQGLVP